MKDQQSHLDFQGRQQAGQRTGWRWICLAVLASAWGLNELIGGPTVWLTGAALLLLAGGWAVMNRLGSSTSLVVVPVGLGLGRLLARPAMDRPRMALRVALAAGLALWVIGPFAG